MFRKIVTSFLLALVGIVGFFGNIEKGNIESTAGVIKYAIIGNEVHAADNWTGPIASNGEKNQGDGNKSSGANTQDEETRKMLNSFVAGLNLILGFLTVIVSPAIVLAGWLMSPDWTSGDVFGLRPMIHALWITISNVIYFIYAVLLIFIALATIFNSDHYGYKALLPKLAIGILMVPLTWWMVQFVISVASYVTTSVITIPMTTVDKFLSKDGNTSLIYQPIIPKLMVYENDKTVYKANEADTGTASDDAKANAFCDGDDGTKCISPIKFMDKGGGSFSPLMVYAYGIFKFQNIPKIGGSVDTIKSIGQIINQAFIGALMFLIFGLLVLALIFMLAMRAIRLWFYAIFSPLFTLQYVVGDSIFGENKDTFSVKEFIGLAFAPALAGLALSFGLVVLSVMVTPPTTARSVECADANTCRLTLFANGENYVETKVTDGKGKGEKVSQTSISIGGVTYRFQGSIVSAGDKSTTQVAKEALSLTGGIFGTIIIDIIALIFIWVAFMAVKGVSKAVSAAIDPFEKMGKKIGDMGMALPKYTPIPGIGLSAKGMEKVVEKGQQSLDIAHEEKMNEEIQKKFPGLIKNAPKANDRARLSDAANEQNEIGKKKGLGVIAEMQKEGRLSSDTNIRAFGEELKKFGNKQWENTEKAKNWLMSSEGGSMESNQAEKVAKLLTEYDKMNSTEREEAVRIIGTKFGTNTTKETPKIESLIKISPNSSITIDNNEYKTDKAESNKDAVINKLYETLKVNKDISQDSLVKRLKEANYPDAETIAKKVFEKISEKPKK